MQKQIMYNKLERFMEKGCQDNNIGLPVSIAALDVFGIGLRGEINILDMIHLDNKNFLTIFYWGCFNCHPNKDIIEEWGERIDNMNNVEFQYEFTKYMSYRKEVISRHVRIRNCIYDISPQYSKNLSLSKIRNQKNQKSDIPLKIRAYYKFLPVYKSLPQGVKVTIKNNFKKYLFD